MSEPVMQRLKISREGIILIKSFEGFRPRAVRRENGQWVIGYGHTLSAREGASVSEADAELLLQYDLIPVAQAVNDGVAQVAEGAVNQHQFDALASFAFSIGIERFRSSDVLSRLIAGSAGEAADAMVNWPEPTPAETPLRRRAAERALFVADPASPVALSDLLSAPLPLPPVAQIQTAEPEPPLETSAPAEPAPDDAEPATPVSSDSFQASDPVTPELDTARQAAVASLLGEMTEPASPAELGGAEPVAATPIPTDATLEEKSVALEPESLVEAIDEPEAAAEWESVAEPAVVEADAPERSPQDTNVFAPEPETTLELVATADPETTAAAVIEAPIAAVPLTFDPLPATTPASFNASSRFSPYAGPIVGALETAETEPAADVLVEAVDEPSPFPSPEPVTPVFGEASGDAEPASTPIVVVAPDGGMGFPPVSQDWASAEPALDEVPTPIAAVQVEPEPAPVVPNWATLTAESEPRADGELLVLTPLPEDSVFPAPRLVWPHGEGDGTETPPLFEDDGSLRLGGSPLLRPEPLEAFTPKRVAWGEMGAFLLMGGFGLISFGMAMAAFRRASQSAGANELTVIAIVLAVFGAVCVGVSAYNLYRRWGRDDAV